jgi:hypothetical protein
VEPFDELYTRHGSITLCQPLEHIHDDKFKVEFNIMRDPCIDKVVEKEATKL